MKDALPTNERGFVLARDARASGRLTGLRAAVARGELERVRAGVYREPLAPDAATSSQAAAAARYRTSVLAVAETLSAPVFTGYSAAALHGLPIIGPWPSEVFVLSRDAHGHRRAGVTSVARPRHIEVGVEVVDGCLVTALDFSLLQLCRQAPLLAALTAVDAVLLEPRRRQQTTPVPFTTLEALQAIHRRLLPYPRSARVDAVLGRATSLADTPLETLSRVTIEELGYPEPELQHELWLPELERRAFLDFYWPEFGIGAEADGRGKYLGDGSVRATVDSVFMEKQREDAIRHQLAGFSRWEWSHAWGRTMLGRRLAHAGLPTTRRPRTLR